VERELAVAKQLVTAQKKDRALLALKRRKLHEHQLTRLDAWLLNVEQLLSNIEMTRQQTRLFEALKAGTSAVRDLQKQVTVQDVEKLLEDSTDAQAYQEEMDRALSRSLSPLDGQEAEAELDKLEADFLRLEAAEQLPTVPKHDVVVDSLEELPDVPSTAVEQHDIQEALTA